MFIVVPFINSTGLAIVAEADLLCGEFLSEKSCRHTMVVSASFWYWLLNVFSVSTCLKYTATIVLGSKCIVGMLMIHGITMFLILVFRFLKFVIFCVYPSCDLLWYNFFFIFQDSVCG